MSIICSYQHPQLITLCNSGEYQLATCYNFIILKLSKIATARDAIIAFFFLSARQLLGIFVVIVIVHRAQTMNGSSLVFLFKLVSQSFSIQWPLSSFSLVCSCFPTEFEIIWSSPSNVIPTCLLFFASEGRENSLWEMNLYRLFVFLCALLV